MNRFIALLLLLLLTAQPVWAGLSVVKSNGITLTGADGIKYVGINGITLTEGDYQTVAPAVVQSLGLPQDAAALSSAQSNVALTKAILEKNRLFFYRWRPQNETYLFGFRKHEQGNNGVEIPMFDPLVTGKEKEIAKLRK